MWLLLAALLAAPPEDSLDKLIAAGQYREALDLLAKAPASPRSHLLASKAYDGLNDPARAVQEAEAGLALDPRQEALHIQLGQIFLGRNTPQAALEVFTDAITLLPDSLLLRLGKGLALKDLARYEEAETELRDCLRRQPDFPLAFDALATVYLHSKRFEDLQHAAGEYRDRHAKDYRGSYFLAAALDGLRQDPARIESLLAESIRLNPGFAAAHALRGKVKLQSGDAAAAIPPLEEAIRLRPDYPPAALHLAQAYQKAGRDADAARAFERVRELKERERAPKPALRYHRGLPGAAPRDRLPP
ncbi:MAG: tetratricopeptide repeat protein [Candidatus Solibacter usitatus]|nr:tetratricopeptide repeat protein [Candidatus Solibacter usitatus]